MGGFPLGSLGEGQMPGGQSNLQLQELQKIFDLFHTQTETVQEIVPTQST